MRSPLLSTLSVLLLSTGALLASCGGGSGKAHPDEPGPAAEPAAAQHADLPEGVHAVVCGCVVPGIGRCGNYIVVDGETLPLAGDIGLGKMEFCGQSGLTAKVEGGVQDGVFVATAYELRE